MKPLIMSGICMTLLLLAGCRADSGSDGFTDNAAIESEQDTLLVYQNRQAVQCESTGISPENSAQTLINHGIDVLQTDCGAITGLSVPAVCGGMSLDIIIHKLHSVNLQSAEELGFADITTLIDDEQGVNYQITECLPSSPAAISKALTDPQLKTLSF